MNIKTKQNRRSKPSRPRPQKLPGACLCRRLDGLECPPRSHGHARLEGQVQHAQPWPGHPGHCAAPEGQDVRRAVPQAWTQKAGHCHSASEGTQGAVRSAARCCGWDTFEEDAGEGVVAGVLVLWEEGSIPRSHWHHICQAGAPSGCCGHGPQEAERRGRGVSDVAVHL